LLSPNQGNSKLCLLPRVVASQSVITSMISRCAQSYLLLSFRMNPLVFFGILPCRCLWVWRLIGDRVAESDLRCTTRTNLLLDLPMPVSNTPSNEVGLCTCRRKTPSSRNTTGASRTSSKKSTSGIPPISLVRLLHLYLS